jgi:DNA-directed RNA polymerase subunit F
MAETERIVSLEEVKNILAKEEKQRELNYEKRLALDHAKTFSKLTVTKTKKLITDLQKLERVSESIAYKIAELLPQHPDDVRAIFAKERFNLEEKEVKQIVDLVKKAVA